MPSQHPLTPQRLAAAVTTQARADGFYSEKAVSSALKAAPRTVRRRLSEAVPLLSPDVAALLGQRHPFQRRIDDATLAAAVAAVVGEGRPPSARAVANRLGCSVPVILRRLPLLPLPPDLRAVVDAWRELNGALPPQRAEPRRNRTGCKPSRTDSEIVSAVCELAEAGAFSVAGLARRLTLDWRTAQAALRRVAGQLPPLVSSIVAGSEPTADPPGSAGKVEVLARRAAAGLPLFDPRDASFGDLAARAAALAALAEADPWADTDEGTSYDPGRCMPRHGGDRHVYRVAGLGEV